MDCTAGKAGVVVAAIAAETAGDKPTASNAVKLEAEADAIEATAANSVADEAIATAKAYAVLKATVVIVDAPEANFEAKSAAELISVNTAFGGVKLKIGTPELESTLWTNGTERRNQLDEHSDKDKGCRDFGELVRNVVVERPQRHELECQERTDENRLAQNQVTHSQIEERGHRESVNKHQIGSYEEQTKEMIEVIQTTNEKGESSSSTRTQSMKWSFRQGKEQVRVESETYNKKTTCTTFKPRTMRYIETIEGVMATRTKAIEHLLGYRQMVELCRIVPEEGINLDPGQMA
jgi:hypothetical protein